jgi:hypothetical protein
VRQHCWQVCSRCYKLTVLVIACVLLHYCKLTVLVIACVLLHYCNVVFYFVCSVGQHLPNTTSSTFGASAVVMCVPPGLQDAVVSGSRLGAYGDAGSAMPGEHRTTGLV